MISPNSGAIMTLMKTGAAFQNPVTGALAATTGVANGVKAQLDGIIAGAGGTAIAALQPAITAAGTLVGAGSALVSLGTHVGNQIASLPQNLSAFAAVTSLKQGLGDSAAFPDPTAPDAGVTLGSICAGAQKMFGSIMGAANDLLDQAQAAMASVQTAISDAMGAITSAIADVQAAITSAVQGAIDAANAALDAVMAPVNAAINAVMAKMDEIKTMIRKEIAEVGKAISDMLGLSGASSLRSLRNHACVQMVLGSVGTPALLNTLNADAPPPDPNAPPPADPPGLPSEAEIAAGAPMQPGETYANYTTRRSGELQGLLAQMEGTVPAAAADVGALNVIRSRMDVVDIELRTINAEIPGEAPVVPPAEPVTP